MTSAPEKPLPQDYARTVAAALGALEVRNLVLGLHAASFPSAPGEDTGRGSPYTEGGRRFLTFARALGFNGLQLGPPGQTSEDNPSPYDGTLFSRNVLDVDLLPLTREGLVRPETVAALVAHRPGGSAPRVQHRYVFRGQHRALEEAWYTFQRERAHAAPSSPVARLAELLQAYRREHHAWLERTALYGVLCREHARPYWREWGSALDRHLYAPRPGEEAQALARRRELLERHAEAVEAFAFVQLLVHEQHHTLRGHAARLGLKLYGDLQIGFAPEDAWAYQGLLLPGYLMGAPPSRTNPEGQPWGYPVLDPGQYAGPVQAFLRGRVGKMLEEYDGLRLDHPHGLVCPWVYRADTADPLRAVQGGARLFSSPDLPDHPELARYAIARPEQLDRSLPRHADSWVRQLTPEQVERYGLLFDTAVAAARARGRQVEDLLCEVLSTLPYPLQRVMERHGLGRFRVAQKADLTRPEDVYRSENAAPEDWVMLGNHDTRPIWLVAERWHQSGEAHAQAEYLAWRLHPEPEGREAFARRLLEEPGLLVQARFADLLACRARNVQVFFADLLGSLEVYNVPGTVSESNWTLRVPNDYHAEYRRKLEQGAALNLPLALALALRAQGPVARERHRELLAGLERVAAELRGLPG